MEASFRVGIITALEPRGLRVTKCTCVAPQSGGDLEELQVFWRRHRTTARALLQSNLHPHVYVEPQQRDAPDVNATDCHPDEYMQASACDCALLHGQDRGVLLIHQLSGKALEFMSGCVAVFSVHLESQWGLKLCIRRRPPEPSANLGVLTDVISA